jgi:hypothetical protein
VALLDAAAAERTQLRRHLLVAAAIREMVPSAIIVGGTAEEYWTARTYHETDLDLCAMLGRAEREALRALGFTREGRHWFHERARVAVEVPGPLLDGDPDRVVTVEIGRGAARVIGVDDLYLDRLRQTTVAPGRDDIHFESALAVASATFESIDWPYIRRRLTAISKEEPSVARHMRAANTVIRRRVRKALS